MSKILYTDLMEYSSNALAQAAYVSSEAEPASWDLLDEDMEDITDWTDDDSGNGVSSESPAGQMLLDGVAISGTTRAQRYRALTSVNIYTFEIEIYHDVLGTKADIDYFRLNYGRVGHVLDVIMASDGLFIRSTGGYSEVGTNLVQTGTWQTWRFIVDSTTPASAVCDVYLNDVLQASGVDCSSVDSTTNIVLVQYARGSVIGESHIDYVKIATGKYPSIQCYSESTIKQQGSYSLKVFAKQTNSLNDTLTKTLTDYLDYSIQDVIKFGVRASRTGSNLQLQIHDTGGTTSTHTVNIVSADTWQIEEWDISGITTTDRNTIDKIIIKIINADADNTFYIDNLYVIIISEHIHTWVG